MRSTRLGGLPVQLGSQPHAVGLRQKVHQSKEKNTRRVQIQFGGVGCGMGCREGCCEVGGNPESRTTNGKELCRRFLSGVFIA